MITADIKKIERNFFPEDFVITTWEELNPYTDKLLSRTINSLEEYHLFLKDVSELEAIVSEDGCWRQIKMTCDTEDETLLASYTDFCVNIQPNIQAFADNINRKILNSPFKEQLDPGTYSVFFRNLQKNVDIFKEENLPLLSELNVLQQQFGATAGKMTVEVEGRQYTLQQAAKFLEDSDRKVRETIYFKIQDRRLQDKDTLDTLFSTLIEKRNQVANNAGFASYVEYKFVELGRFDYTPDDCFQFHRAVKEHVLPLVETIHRHKKESLGLESLRPWDLEATPLGEEPLRPFETGRELIEKTIVCFEKIHPFFADCLKKMDEMGRFDVESRKGKAPGGYNCPLAETGAPFIFMNAASQTDDVTTMLHEGGHAFHSFLSHPLTLSGFKEYPMEIAEVASMTMELVTMDYWDIFYPDRTHLLKAKKQQLERVITIFPWIATIDAFQHWVYQHPKHSHEERRTNWLSISEEFSSKVIDYTGLEQYRGYGWQRQLHLFEVPFYYIEYGIAQLGAIGIWKHFKSDPTLAIERYINALSLGGTKTLPELYAAAGLTFDFSPAYIQGLMAFVKEELDALYSASEG